MIPSGKLIALSTVSLCIIGVAFYYAERKNSTETSVYVADTQTAQAVNLIAGTADSYKDTDGDGLKDWEEVLWGTNPKSPDAEKIQTLGTTTQRTKKALPLTSTDTLARNFFTQYMNLKQVGLENDPTSMDRVALNVVDTSLEDISKKTYTSASVKVSDAVLVKDYINNVGGILKHRTPKISRSELTIFRDALQNENPTALRELEISSRAYEAIVQDLLSLAVPRSLSELHVRLVNNMNDMAFIIVSFRKAFSDPAVSVQGLSLFQQAFADTVAIFREYRSVVSSGGITYGTQDGGYFFTVKTDVQTN